MMRSWAYNRLGVLMGTSWSVSCPHWHGLRDNSLPMITLFLSQGGFCSTASNLFSLSWRQKAFSLGLTLGPARLPGGHSATCTLEETNHDLRAVDRSGAA